MRLIDADALKTTASIQRADFNTIKTIRQWIDEAPTIDPAAVRHGRWIIEDNPWTGWYRVTCSECGEDVTSTAPCIGFPPDAKVTWDYCPYCGAKMEEDNETD